MRICSIREEKVTMADIEQEERLKVEKKRDIEVEFQT